VVSVSSCDRRARQDPDKRGARSQPARAEVLRMHRPPRAWLLEHSVAHELTRLPAHAGMRAERYEPWSSLTRYGPLRLGAACGRISRGLGVPAAADLSRCV